MKPSLRSDRWKWLPLLLVVCAPPESSLAQVESKKTNNAISSKTFTYKTVGQLELKVDVHRLPGDEIRPAILWIHGGALLYGARGMLPANQRQLFLQAGFVVISIDYRLAPETLLPAIIEDVQDAWRWLRVEGRGRCGLDPERVAVMGGSAGGYLALILGAEEPGPRAVASLYGYGDLLADWLLRPAPNHLGHTNLTRAGTYQSKDGKEVSSSWDNSRLWFYVYCRQNGIWPKEVMGLDPATVPEKFERFRPIRRVTKDYPPTFLLHGDHDRDVPFSASEQMAEALAKHGVPHRLVPMKGLDHLFDLFPSYTLPPQGQPFEQLPPKVGAAFDEMVAFLKQHVAR